VNILARDLRAERPIPRMDPRCAGSLYRTAGGLFTLYAPLAESVFFYHDWALMR
jgi:hypothetical protein